MPIATDVRDYADADVKQGKTVLSQAAGAINTATGRVVELSEDAPKPVYAVLGAADLAVESVAKRLPKGATGRPPRTSMAPSPLVARPSLPRSATTRAWPSSGAMSAAPPKPCSRPRLPRSSAP